MHARQKNHAEALVRKDNKNPLVKHVQTDHHNDSEAPNFSMSKLSNHRNNLSRFISEGIWIDKSNQDLLLNSKGEWGRGKVIRMTSTIDRY